MFMKFSFLLLCFLCLFSTAKADYSIIYSVLTSTEACVTRVTGTPTGVVAIPQTVTIDGKEYTVTQIKGSSFENCDQITGFILPDNISVIGGSAFAYCTALKSVNIPTSLEALAGTLFDNCSSLESIEIPANIKRINDKAFNNCFNLKNVVVQNPVPPQLYSSAFNGCHTNMRVYVSPSALEAYKGDSSWNSLSLNSLFVVKGLNSIENGIVTADKIGYTPGSSAVFRIVPDQNFKLGNVIINGTNFTSQVNSGELVYANVTKDLTISVTFEATEPLFVYTVLTGNTVSIARNPKVTLKGEVVIPSTVSIGGVLYTVTTLANASFSSCTEITSVVIPSTVTKIEGSSFKGCSKLSSVSLPSSVTVIGGNGFDGCTSLVSVSLPDNLEALAGYLFNGCTSLKDVKLPANLDRINEYAFNGCSSLTNIVFPKSLRTINANVFSGCIALVDVTCHATTPPTVSQSSFYSYNKTALHVSSSALDAYAGHAVWSQFIMGYTTPIYNIKADAPVSGKIYNLSGQEVDDTYRGVVIINGRKYIRR